MTDDKQAPNSVDVSGLCREAAKSLPIYRFHRLCDHRDRCVKRLWSFSLALQEIHHRRQIEKAGNFLPVTWQANCTRKIAPNKRLTYF
jgi:hypothetical protein